MSSPAVDPTYKGGYKSVTANDADADPGQRGAAFEFLSKLALEVSGGTVELPCFPDVVIRIRNALADPRTTPEQTVRIVGAEPRLAARLLQTANSAAFNTTGRPITELRAAITRLGHQLVQSAAMAFAVQQMSDESSLKSIAEPLTELWNDCIAVASISQVVARKTKVSPDEAFLTGLLHGIGRLYIMVRSVSASASVGKDASWVGLVSDWHASIGKTVLENWGFIDTMCEAVGEQESVDRKLRHEADLTDVLLTSIVLSHALKIPEPRKIEIDGVPSIQHIGMTAQDCATTLTHAEYQLGALHEALGC